MNEEAEVNTGEELGEKEGQTDVIEERARSQGWVPKEEFRGDESRWVDAEEFVKKGEESLPILRERLRAMEKRNQELYNGQTELKKTLKEFAEHHKTVSEREYSKALKEIKRQKAEAVELGDKDAFTKAEAQEEELKTHKPKEIKVDDTPEGVHPDFPGWVEENQWYSTDKVLRGAADAVAEDLAKTSNLQGRAFFDAVKEQMKKELPDKFENPRRKQPASVETGGERPKKGGKSYADLPAEAKKACDKFVSQKLMTKEQYVKEYDWS